MRPFIALLLVPIVYITACSSEDTGAGDSASKTTIPVLSHTVAAIYPHDTSSYTQGLEFYKGQLIEGTGNYGSSKLMHTDLVTGKEIRGISLDSAFFGEGITILNDTLYQLTYKEKKVFVYTAHDFKKINEFSLDTEGWGLTNDGTNLIVTDGSNNLYFYNPTTFRLMRTQGVTENGSPSVNLNELEYINGYVYANQYMISNYIFKIDPASGQVVAKLDLTDLANRTKSTMPGANVLNGIAYNPETKKVYVTGKLWPQLYEIRFPL